MTITNDERAYLQDPELLLRSVQVHQWDMPMGTEHVAEESGIIGIDVETSGLDWRHNRIATFQACVPGRSLCVVQVCEREPRCLLTILANPAIRKVFHHAAFDLRFILSRWPTKVVNVACTKIASKVLSGNGVEHHLKDLLSRYLNVQIDKRWKTSDWFADELSQGQIRYAASDVAYLPDLLRVLEVKLKQAGKLELARSCFDFLPTRVELDLAGVPDVFCY